jgi:hypothetical protein
VKLLHLFAEVEKGKNTSLELGEAELGDPMDLKKY